MTPAEPASPGALEAHYFRRELARLVAVLSRRFGLHRLELCEDAAQTALMRALESWPRTGEPADRSAWLYRVATNHALDVLRRDRRNDGLAACVEPAPDEWSAEPVYLEAEVRDDLLRMLFVCADPRLPEESRIALALKTLCGFGTDEIALRLFQGVEAIHKRLQRARATLREQAVELDSPPIDELAARMPSVLHMLYLLFNEGYSSAKPDSVIRRELCADAIRLARMLEAHPVGRAPELDALLSLMHFHGARLDSRVDGAGALLLLSEQDRTQWDRDAIAQGVMYLGRSARGEQLSRYHVEAAIAAEHCLAPSYAETRWEEIARLYAMLDRVAPSPLNTLHRAIAIAEWRDPDAALSMLEALTPPGWLLRYYLWDATLGELYRRRGDRARAIRCFAHAVENAPTEAEQALIRARLRAASEETS